MHGMLASHFSMIKVHDCSVFPGYTEEGLSDYCEQISFLSVINVCLVT